MAVAAVGFVCAGAARFLWVQRRCRHAVRALMSYDFSSETFCTICFYCIYSKMVLSDSSAKVYLYIANQQFGPLNTKRQLPWPIWINYSKAPGKHNYFQLNEYQCRANSRARGPVLVLVLAVLLHFAVSFYYYCNVHVQRLLGSSCYC